ncbi:MAG: YicC family protein [Pseudomonadota bacterium]|nr:MAG: YicC family protein [Pseudomonadota bacterium]
MTRSMTAFARADSDTAWGHLACELRSVNHRYLDFTAKLPEELRALETRIRERVAEHVDRGKVECLMRYRPNDSGGGATELDEEQVRRLLAASDRLLNMSGAVAPLRAIDVLRWPGALKVTPVDTDALNDAALRLLDQALTDFVATREREGARLRELIGQRLDGMRKVVSQVREYLPEIAQTYRERLLARLQEARQQLDPNRLEQEMVLFASRSDVTEELDRLDTHVREVRRVLDQRGAAGRRLDFLMQELNREANTLGSKAVDIRMTNASVELKVLIEQMREQVQNVE